MISLAVARFRTGTHGTLSHRYSSCMRSRNKLSMVWLTIPRKPARFLLPGQCVIMWVRVCSGCVLAMRKVSTGRLLWTQWRAGHMRTDKLWNNRCAFHSWRHVVSFHTRTGSWSGPCPRGDARNWILSSSGKDSLPWTLSLPSHYIKIGLLRSSLSSLANSCLNVLDYWND